ncbi:MAG: GHMP kinase [Nitrosopumilus sp. H8]|nr:MAG: GHMP kinase [Nitrosopumilus sp. H13]RNJ78032.1 MAG: GHMP kinase [Nitrosopumilus sp. H8]
MAATAFCPAHVTGFFKAHLKDSVSDTGSMGAGFSIKQGVTTRVRVSPRNGRSGYRITTTGYRPDKTDVSEFVIREFLKLGEFSGSFLDIKHEIGVPVGYGLGSSGAVALSLAFALDSALHTGLDRNKIGMIAHNAEVSCKTGLGDVLASFHGGFEVRVRPGAPGVGSVEMIPADDMSVIMVCFSPISTNKFIKENLSRINGLGGRMVDMLLESRDCGHFQDMSLEFARYVNVMTPRMQRLVDDLARNGTKCGVALFGETVFSMVHKEDEAGVLEILQRHPGGTLIRSELDHVGARVLDN